MGRSEAAVARRSDPHQDVSIFRVEIQQGRTRLRCICAWESGARAIRRIGRDYCLCHRLVRVPLGPFQRAFRNVIPQSRDYCETPPLLRGSAPATPPRTGEAGTQAIGDKPLDSMRIRRTPAFPILRVYHRPFSVIAASSTHTRSAHNVAPNSAFDRGAFRPNRWASNSASSDSLPLRQDARLRAPPRDSVACLPSV
jgi:hypothetical protein